MMASILRLRYLFTATSRGMSNERIACASLMNKSSWCHSFGCCPAIKTKPSMLLLHPNGRHLHHNQRFTMSAAHPKSSECNVKIVGDGKELKVVWPGKGGDESTYHATWLKHGCHCPLCWEEATTQHLVWDIEPDPSRITISRAIPTGTVVYLFLLIPLSFQFFHS